MWRLQSSTHKETLSQMKKFMGIMLGLSLVIGAATVTFAADDKDTTKKSTDKKTGKKTGKKSTDKKTTEKM